MSSNGIDNITYFARTNARPPNKLFGIKQADRLFHMYVIGKTGTGKSTLLETLMRQDLVAGRGMVLIDPHGDLVERVVRAVPEERCAELFYLDAPDPNQPFGYNPLRRVHPNRIALAASGILEAFKKHWNDAWGVRMEHVLRNALFALLEHGESSLPDILRLLNDAGYRKSVAAKLTNQPVKDFWLTEYDRYSFRYRADSIAPIQNKVGALLADPLLRRILTDSPRQLRIRSIMDEGQILLVNLARGKIGEDSAALLGSLLVTTIGLAAFSRADTPTEARSDFMMYLDEFQNFTTLSVATMISELRKFRTGLIVANQHLSQLDDAVRDAILGNVGTIVSFRTGPQDAAMLAREFVPNFQAADFVNLPNHEIYLKLMIDGAPTRAFSARTVMPNAVPEA